MSTLPSQVFYNFHNEPIPDAESALQKLQPHYNMMIVTKGGLFEQERKINASGFLPYFNMGYEVMVRKDAEEYCTKIFEKNDLLADETVMVGNSIKSDILPAIACGAYAIHIPYHTTWSQEVAKEPTDHPRYYKAEFISQVPEIVQKINDDLQNKLKSAHSLKL
ncbi:MAG: HAD hydrolase-like protein [Alphaproteobacteria bacterium]